MSAVLRPVSTDPLPDYPHELCDPELNRGYFMMFWHRRWLSSRLCLTASMAVQGAAFNLYCLAQEQVPIGSLPADDKMLARLLRLSDVQWAELMSEDVTPLHGWVKYAHEGDVVLGHPVVIEVAFAAMQRREERRLSNEDRAVGKRRERLVGLMAELGCSKAVCDDAGLVAWLDEWLVVNHAGQRRRPGIDTSLNRALQQAHKEGRFKV